MSKCSTDLNHTSDTETLAERTLIANFQLSGSGKERDGNRIG